MTEVNNQKYHSQVAPNCMLLIQTFINISILMCITLMSMTIVGETLRYMGGQTHEDRQYGFM